MIRAHANHVTLHRPGGRIDNEPRLDLCFDRSARQAILRPRANCLYCGRTLRELDSVSEFAGRRRQPTDLIWRVERSLRVCDTCGWWAISNFEIGQDFRWDADISGKQDSESIAILKELDLADVSVPVEELQTYLLAKRDTRFQLHPRKFEETVASIFGALGYDVRLSSYAGDEGIDIVVMDGPGDQEIGVQVKRYRSRIEAEQIRAFLGALTLKKFSKGIFITTSDYRSGAHKTVASASSLGYVIKLWNGDKFLDRLRIANRIPYSTPNDDTAGFFEPWHKWNTRYNLSDDVSFG